MFKLVIAFAMMATAMAALQPLRTLPSRPLPSYNTQPGRVIAILRSNSEIAPDGSSYQYDYETENGISAQESGSLEGSGPDAALAARGGYQYTSPEGVPVQITYIADGNGFIPSGDVIPTPPPTPEAILRALAYNEAHPEPESSGPGARRGYVLTTFK